MLIKNSWKILVNNLSVVFKVMLYRLIVGVVSVGIIYVIFAETISTMLESEAFKNFATSISTFWHQFISGDFQSDVDLKAPFVALLTAAKGYLSKIVWVGIAATFILFLAAYVKNVCNFVASKMLYEKTSKMQKVGFTQTFFESLKRALAFEAIYTVLELFAIIFAVGLGLTFLVFTVDYLSILSAVIGMWIAIFIITLFMSFTATFRPSVVKGGSIKAIWKKKYSAKDFWLIFASMLFALVISVYFNVSMFVMTLASGIFVSLPLTTVFALCMQLVLSYALDEEKYYIDYEHVVIPNKLKEDADNAAFLRDIEI